MRKLVMLAVAVTAAFTLIFSANKAYAVTYYLFHHTDTGGFDSGYCLNDPNNSTTNGTQMQIWSCGGGGNLHGEENIQMVAGTGGWNGFFLLKLQNGKCLDATNGGGNGVKLQIYTCMSFGSDFNQIWSEIVDTNVNQWAVYSGGGCIDDTNNSNTDGNKVQTWSCFQPPDNAQSWAESVS